MPQDSKACGLQTCTVWGTLSRIFFFDFQAIKPDEQPDEFSLQSVAFEVAKIKQVPELLCFDIESLNSWKAVFQ